MQAFMQDAALFIALIIAVVVGLVIWRIPIKQLPALAQTKDGKYTHHSCALNPDRNSYDALGVELEWCVWGCYKK